MIDKCANPECSVPFDQLEGRFFRFRYSCAPNEPPPNTHSVQHFWLCSRCSQTYTLHKQEEHGVAIGLRLLLREQDRSRLITRAA